MRDRHATKRIPIRRDNRAWLPTTLQRLSPAHFIRTANRVLRGDDVIVRLTPGASERLSRRQAAATNSRPAARQPDSARKEKSQESQPGAGTE